MSGIHDHVRGSAGAGANEAGGFFASILSGFLIGFGLDAWLDTEPLLVVLGIVAGSATGFWKMWQLAKEATEHHDG